MIKIFTSNKTSYYEGNDYGILIKSINNQNTIKEIIILKGRSVAKKIDVIKLKDKIIVYPSKSISDILVFDSVDEFNSYFSSIVNVDVLEKREDIKKIVDYNGKKLLIYGENNKILTSFIMDKINIDFIFPSFNIFERETYILTDAFIPPTVMEISNYKIENVYWIIEYYNDFMLLPYPFNTSGGACTGIHDKINMDAGNYLAWYLEVPTREIPSIKVEFLPLLLYCLKTKKHDLLPLFYCSFSKKKDLTIRTDFILSDGNKKYNIKNSFSFNVKDDNYKKYLLEKYGKYIKLKDKKDIKIIPLGENYGS